MTLSAKLRAVASSLRDLLSHGIAGGKLSTALRLAPLALAGFMVFAGWSALREFRASLAWSADAGRPVKLRPIKAERDGRLALVAPPAGRPCVGEFKPRDAATVKELQRLGVDFSKHSLLATGEIPKGAAPYGGSLVVVSPKAGGGQAEPIFTAANPLASWDNRFAYYAGAVKDSSLGYGARVGVEWDAFSFRLPARAGAFRLFGRVAADGYLFSGRVEGRVSALAVLRRP